MTIDDLTFEERARRAAAGLNDAVASADLQMYAAGIPALQTAETPRGWRLVGNERWMAAAGAFAAVLIVVGIALLPGRFFASDGDVATPEPTIPETLITTVDSAPDGTGEVSTTIGSTEPTATTTPESEVTSSTIAADTTPPEIVVTSPEDGATVGGEQSEAGRGLLQFQGTTEPGARVVVAGKWDADVDAEGHWEIILGLNSGANVVTFTAIDEAGNENTIQITVTYDPPSPTTTTTKPEEEPGGEEGTDGGEHEFSAFASFGECEEDPPFDVYYGTAAPGEKIIVTSSFGEGTVYADETGNWELRVEFPEAPFEETFLVTVTNVDTGASKNFEFISYAG